MTHDNTLDDNIKKLAVSRKCHKEITGERPSILYRYEYFIGKQSFFMRKRISTVGRLAMLVASMGMLHSAKNVAESVDKALHTQESVDVDYDIEVVKRAILEEYEMEFKA